MYYFRRERPFQHWLFSLPPMTAGISCHQEEKASVTMMERSNEKDGRIYNDLCFFPPFPVYFFIPARRAATAVLALASALASVTAVLSFLPIALFLRSSKCRNSAPRGAGPRRSLEHSLPQRLFHVAWIDKVRRAHVFGYDSNSPLIVHQSNAMHPDH